MQPPAGLRPAVSVEATGSDRLPGRLWLQSRGRCVAGQKVIRLGESQVITCSGAHKLRLRIKITEEREAENSTSLCVLTEHNYSFWYRGFYVLPRFLPRIVMASYLIFDRRCRDGVASVNFPSQRWLARRCNICAGLGWMRHLRQHALSARE